MRLQRVCHVQEAEKEQTQKLFQQARVLKIIAAVVAVLVFLLVIVWAVLFFKSQARLRGNAGLEFGPRILYFSASASAAR